MDVRQIGQGLLWTVATGPEPAPTLLPRRWAKWQPIARGVLVAIAGVMALGATSNAQGHGLQGEIVAAFSAGPLALLPFRPLLAWRLAWVVGLIGLDTPAPGETDLPWHPVQVVVFLAVLLVVSTTQPPAVLGWIWISSLALGWVGATPGNRPGIVVFFTILMIVGDQIRRRVTAQRELAVEEERGALLNERARIARELHDVVAHHMSMIAVRAETAPFRLRGLSDPVRAEFADVSRAAREGLTEMRRLLGVLRNDTTAEPPPTAPQPGLADLPALVDGARDAGTDVRLVGTVPEAPAGVGLSAYRIVQEALSNAARHAPGAPVTVWLHHTGDHLHVLVHNGRPENAPPPRLDGEGHGLVGMRERASMLGGTVVAEATVDGGYEVRATIPAARGAA